MARRRTDDGRGARASSLSGARAPAALSRRQRIAATAPEPPSSEPPASAAPPVAPSAPEAMSPLDYMLAVMRDPAVEAGRRDGMAKAAAPYCLAKANATEREGREVGRGPIDFGLQDDSDLELVRRVAFLLSKPRVTMEGSL